MAVRSSAQSPGAIWLVVGGRDRGGVLVRAGPELSSPKLEERLANGALIEEQSLLLLESAGERLCYRRLTSTGPTQGWISVVLNGAALAERVPPAADDIAPAVAASREETLVALHYTASYDKISVEVHALLDVHPKFLARRVYTSKELREEVLPQRYDWFHTVTKLKQPSEYCPKVALVGVMPHLYELEEKSLLQEFMNAHSFASCISGFVFTRSVDEETLEVAVRKLGLPCIVKPSNEGGRRGIRIAESLRDVVRAARAFSRAPTWVAQRLEAPAFLLVGHKFHLRVFAFVLVGRDGILEIHLAKSGPIYFSKAPYDTSSNKAESLLTGGGGTGYSRTWPAFIEQMNCCPGLSPGDVTELLLSQLRNLCHDFLVTVSAPLKFERASYRLVAFDVLLCAVPQTHFQAKVMEVNISPSSEFQDPSLCHGLARGMLHCLWRDQFPADDLFELVATSQH